MHLVWVRASVLGLLNFEKRKLSSLKTVTIGYVAYDILVRCLDRLPRSENVAKQISWFKLIHKVSNCNSWRIISIRCVVHIEELFTVGLMYVK
jgi:hypothetical protein